MWRLGCLSRAAKEIGHLARRFSFASACFRCVQIFFGPWPWEKSPKSLFARFSCFFVIFWREKCNFQFFSRLRARKCIFLCFRRQKYTFVLQPSKRTDVSFVTRFFWGNVFSAPDLRVFTSACFRSSGFHRAAIFGFLPREIRTKSSFARDLCPIFFAWKLLHIFYVLRAPRANVWAFFLFWPREVLIFFAVFKE